MIADDQEMIRRGLRRTLESHADIQVVGEATDDVDALELIRRERPDVALVDVRIPRMDGLELTRRVDGSVAPEVRVRSPRPTTPVARSQQGLHFSGAHAGR